MATNYTNNFDKVAPFYDVLSQLVFGKAQINAQKNQLSFLQKNNRILIAGGGTGFILEAISNQYHGSLDIVFVEISQNMIKKAQKRMTQNNNVCFVNIDIQDYTSNQLFDVIMTPFLFDNFSEETAVSNFNQLNHLLKNNGLWFTNDFCLTNGSGKLWKILLTKMMYLFFKIFKITNGHKLIDLQKLFIKNNYIIKQDLFYYSKFIEARVFQKINESS